MKKKLLIIGSLPPPYTGYETATEVLLRARLDEYFTTEFFDYSTAKSANSRGKISLVNVIITLKVFIRLIIRLVRFRPDIVNLPLSQNRTGFYKWLLLALPCKLLNSQIVSRFGGASFKEFYFNSGTFNKKVIIFGLSLIKVVILRSPSLKEQFKDLPILLTIEIVPNGFDVDFWREDLVKKYNETLHVVFLGTISYAKGAFDYIYAIKHLLDKNISDIRFSMAGPILTKERNIIHLQHSKQIKNNDIKSLVKQLKLENKISFIPPVTIDEKKKLLGETDILVAPSYSEGGVPYVILEALASKCAVISTPVIPVSDYLTNNKNILIVPYNSPNMIAEEIIKLRDNRALVKSLGQLGLKYVIKNHSLPVFRERMKSVFNRLI